MIMDEEKTNVIRSKARQRSLTVLGVDPSRPRRRRHDDSSAYVDVDRWLSGNELPMKEARFFRSTTHRTMSTSTISELSIKESDLVDPSPSIVSSMSFDPCSLRKSIRLRIIEYHHLLSLIDQKNLNQIREELPEEFSQLIPQLVQFGVVQCPKKFLENNSREGFTNDEMIQCEHFCSLIVDAYRKKKNRASLHHLYSSDLIRYDIHHQSDPLRQTLSFQGQISLLKTYEDQIERELNRHVSSWKLIPIDLRSSSTSSSSSSSSSTITKSKRATNSRTKSSTSSKVTFEWNLKKLLNLQIDDYEYLLQLSSIDQFDEQWNEKIIVQLIEQAMNIFEQLTLLSNYNHQSNLTEQTNKYRLVQAFKRWLRLTRILLFSFI